MKLYISGAVTGIDNFEELFHNAYILLSHAGYDAINPTLQCESSWTWDKCMRTVLKTMLDCDGVATLENWENSKGAKIEVSLARSLSIPVKSVAEWLDSSLQ